MRVATFNILHGQTVTGPRSHSEAGADPGLLNSRSSDSLIESIHQLGADVIGLQEVDVNQPRSNNVHQPKLLAEATGADWWRFVPTVMGTPGSQRGFRSSSSVEREISATGGGEGLRYGVALLSKLPVLEWRTTVFAPARMSLPLLVQTSGRPRMIRVRDEQRAAIAAVVETASGPMTVVTAHLSFVPGYNIRQLRQLRAWLSNLPRPLVLMGDFNLPLRLPPRVTGWPALLDQPTFPSYGPRVQFDHILLDGFNSTSVSQSRASAQAVRLPVSDHCAAVADLAL